MNVIKSSEGISKADIFKMTQDPKVDQIKNHGGETLTLKNWVRYNDVNTNGNEVELLAIQCEECTVATNSKTFIDGFMKMVEYFAEDGVKHFEVIEDTNKKNNRTFYQCSYVD